MATKKTAVKKKVVSKKPVTKKTLAKPTSTQSVPVSSGNRLIKEKAQDLKQLFSHAVVYVAVNAFLIFVNFATSPERLWFFWVLIGWGIGLAFHWLDVMNYSPFDEKKMEQEAQKILKR